MGKTWSVVALALAIMLQLPAARAYQNEPTGFRGIAWGTPVDTVRAKVETWYNRDVDPGLVEYRSRSELSMNGIPLNFGIM
jgi:hypothetical protein